MKLTPTEKQIILHRLAVPDAIAECLTDHGDDELPTIDMDADDVQAWAENLYARVEATGVIPDRPAPVEAAILADCVEGSTFFGNAEDAVACGELSQSKLNRQYAAMEGLAEKIGKIVGRQVKPSMY